jgi:hypothetical protein
LAADFAPIDPSYFGLFRELVLWFRIRPNRFPAAARGCIPLQHVSRKRSRAKPSVERFELAIRWTPGRFSPGSILDPGPNKKWLIDQWTTNERLEMRSVRL